MEEEKSKSQKKREAEALQKLGVALSKLSQQQLDDIPMPDKLRQAINELGKIKSNSAVRRQSQYIGRLMRETELGPIQQAFDEIQQGTAKANAKFHLVERWRDKLLNEGNPALTEFLNFYPGQDVQQLRHLIQQAIKERNSNKNLGSSKSLFRLIKSIVS